MRKGKHVSAGPTQDSLLAMRKQLPWQAVFNEKHDDSGPTVNPCMDTGLHSLVFPYWLHQFLC
ncbi:MAG TPA: hypothetical protein VNB54_13885, partial [Alphaproteobacteria bacterium]|nr:hypothetical protein [Alphaproteobacteria bacterium]